MDDRSSSYRSAASACRFIESGNVCFVAFFFEHAHRFARAVSVGRASLSRQKSRNRRSLRAANGSSKIALRAGIISTCPKSWAKPTISIAGKRSCRQSPTARWSHGSISTCLVSTISPMTSCRIQWESSPQNWQLESRRLWGSHISIIHLRTRC